jgi:hypothetical protein
MAELHVVAELTQATRLLMPGIGQSRVSSERKGSSIRSILVQDRNGAVGGIDLLEVDAEHHAVVGVTRARSASVSCSREACCHRLPFSDCSARQSQTLSARAWRGVTCVRLCVVGNRKRSRAPTERARRASSDGFDLLTSSKVRRAPVSFTHCRAV